MAAALQLSGVNATSPTWPITGRCTKYHKSRYLQLQEHEGLNTKVNQTVSLSFIISAVFELLNLSQPQGKSKCVAVLQIHFRH